MNRLLQLLDMCKRMGNGFNAKATMVFALLMMASGSVGLRAQTDYSGAYFIRNMGKNANASNIYYLCPTEGWAYYEATNKVTATDNGQPFLTTYKCKDGVYDASKAVWIVEKHPEIEAYYIKQNKTGRYMVSNGALTGTSGTGLRRARVHLEAVADAAALDALADLALFEIVDNGNNCYGIIPHSTAGWNGTNEKYLGPNNGNYNQLTGQNSKTDGPSDFKNTGGIISVFSYDPSGDWQFEDVVSLPTIADNGDGTVTITNPNGGGIIYYTIDGETPSESSSSISTAAGTVTLAANQRNVVKAVVVLDGITSRVASRAVDLRPMTDITSLSEIAESGGRYRLMADINSAGNGLAITFTGTLDGNYHTISGLSGALFQSADGAVIKNVTLADVNISGSDNVGAICNEATGATKIYNCGVLSGSVTSTGGNAGGLVGQIAAGSSVRVVNCYNYATISGSDYAGGIVGKNEGLVGDVRIALCMMYGNMTTGTNRSPVYGGNHTSNSQNYTEYNFWRSKANLTYTAYNDQLAIDKDEYLTRFPFYRHILNTHREMAAYFLFADHTDEHVDEIGHWVLNTAVAPYPIIEQWQRNTRKTTEDIRNNLPNTTDKGKGKLLSSIDADGYYTGSGTKVTAMGNGGYLSVSISINGSSYSASLPITDMNEARFDYTWGKVVLPHANEFSGWTRDYDYVCTGWEITSVTKDGSSLTSFSIPAGSPYNFADRDNPQKDIYDATSNPYVFAQGANYIVPYGVTAISIKAHFARAYYLSDPYSDVGYKADYSGGTNLGWQVPTTYHDKTVYTSLSTLVGQLNNASNPNNQAIVLVGNYHYRVVGSVDLDKVKAVTIMSCDEDNNQEPDYAWYMGNTVGRIELPPIRFDLPVIEIGMAARVNGSSGYPGVGIWHVHGWFELTENSLNNSSQFEINSSKCNSDDNGAGNNRWIANSGCFVQIVRCRQSNCNKLSYIQIGGNAYIKELYPGSHTDNGNVTTSVPILVTGGQVDECFMTGYTSVGDDKKHGTLIGDMIYFWSAGGKIGKYLGAYLEEPTAAGLTAKIDHADIGRFFGGGTSVAARIKGNIDITINNSHVDFYCGGPEFGDMYDGKTLATHAIGTTFGEYYGAGFGGTSITYVRKAQTKQMNINAATEPYDLDFTNYTNNRLKKDDTYGIGTCYKFEFIFNSNATSLVTRFYTGYAQFSLATTGNVTSDLTNCTIEHDFYGAGCQGKVNGTVTSTLTGCTVKGNAFGGGFKAVSNELSVYTTTQPTYSVFTKETGLFSDFGEFHSPETYTWTQGTASNKNTVVSGEKQIYTDITMTDLGNVTGDISITIGGDSKIGTDGDSTTGSVYGGGNESKSLANTTVTLKGNTEVLGDVFGGGNRGLVVGSATVNITE